MLNLTRATKPASPASADTCFISGGMERRFQPVYVDQKLAVDRYGASGANCWYNKYRMAKCLEKLGRIQESCALLEELMAANAHAVDARVADNNNLKLRVTKIKEVNDLQ